MIPGKRPQMDACALDVHAILQRSVASLYSHLVTRPTGRAVREAIESQLGELSRPALSLVDLSSVSVLDYSCADEVVAKLLLQESRSDGGVFIVLMGVRAHHRDPIDAVLERHRLSVVAEDAEGGFDLIGAASEGDRALWRRIEARRWVPAGELAVLSEGGEAPGGLDRLIQRRLLFRDPLRGDLHALSTLIRASGTGDAPEGFQSL